MTATSLNALRNGANPQDGSDDQLDQVRDLLVGEHIRTNDTRLNSLEARVRDLETDLSRQVDALNVRLEALAGEVNNDQRTAFDELANSIADLGNRIRTIAKP